MTSDLKQIPGIGQTFIKAFIKDFARIVITTNLCSPPLMGATP